MSEKLGRYLFIGLGGSGGKTLQYLHNNLSLKLASVNKPMPKGWQFLWFDVPQNPDSLESGSGIKPLPEKYYVPLTNIGLSYSSYDRNLRKRFPQIHDMLAGWSPEASQVTTPVTTGAGQFRAIGRVITMKSYKDVYDKIKDTLNSLQGADVLEELDSIQSSLSSQDIDTGVKEPEPMIVLVSSLAGGSGSGSTIDVADIVRSVVQNNNISEDFSVGLLYTPDIFLGEPKLKDNSAIHANSVFGMSEILSGYYDSDKVQPDNIMWSTFGMLAPESRRRGPRFNFLIGRSNGQVTFQSPQDVFRNTGKLLAEWCLDPTIDSTLREFVLTNWDSESRKNPNNNGIIKKVSSSGKVPVHPFNSLGYSSVNLGREFFSDYSSKRSAKKAITHITRAHWDIAVQTGQQTSAKKLQTLMDNLRNYNHLLVDSGLDELGKDSNQIKEKIQEPENSSIKDEFVKKIFDFAANDNEERNKSEWAEKFSEAFDSHKEDFVREVRKNHIKNARVWVKHFNVEFTNFISTAIAEKGAPLILEWLKDLDIVLKKTLDDKDIGLREELVQQNKFELYTMNYIEERLKELGDNSFTNTHPSMTAVKTQIGKSLGYKMDADVSKITIDLVEEVVETVLPEFRKILIEICQKNEFNLDPTRDNGPGKEVQSWPDDKPTDASVHSENEALIEEIDEYQDIYERLLNSTFIGEAQGDDAEVRLIEKVISGEKIPLDFMDLPDSEKRKLRKSALIYIDSPWVPQKDYLTDGNRAPQKPKLSIDVDIFTIKEKAEAILNEKGTPFGTYLSQSLSDYLAPTGLDPDEHQARTDKFMLAFRKALDYARPQIEVNNNLHKVVHDDDAKNIIQLSKISIKNQEIKEEITKELLPKFNNDPAAVSKLFSTENDGSQSISFFSYYSVPMDITVMRSLWSPFIEKWNGANNDTSDLANFWLYTRSRPLDEFIPMHPKILLSLIKGYFISCLNGQIITNRETKNSSDPLQVHINVDDYGKVGFPSPLIESNPRPQDELGALILSLPLAMGLFSTEQDIDALIPYKELIELGLDSDSVAGTEKISTGLEDYLNSHDENSSNAKDSILKWMDAYKSLRMRPIFNSNRFDRYPGLGWELVPKIIEALQHMHENVKDFESRHDVNQKFN